MKNICITILIGGLIVYWLSNSHFKHSFQPTSIELPNTSAQKLSNENREISPTLSGQLPLPRKQETKPNDHSVLKGELKRISVNESTIADYKQGTIIKIPANAFRHADGRMAEDSVDIVVTEFYLLKDILAHKLTTVCDGELIESAGMIHLQAYANEEELQLADDKSIQIAIPAGRGDGYQLYYGKTAPDETVQWELDKNANVSTQFIRAIRTRNNKLVPLSAEYNKLFQKEDACSLELKQYLLEDISGKFVMKDFNFRDQDGEILEQTFIAKANPIEITSKSCNVWTDIQVKLPIDGQGALGRPEITGLINQNLREVLEKSFDTLPKLSPSFFDPVHNGVEKLCLHFQHEKKPDFLPIQNIFTVDNGVWSSEDINSFQIANEPAKGYYVMNTARLGYVNCDRILRDRVASNIVDKTKKSFTTVRVSTNVETEGYMFLVLDNARSLLNGEKENGVFTFANIPLNCKARLVHVIYKDGVPVTQTRQITIKADLAYTFHLDPPRSQPSPSVLAKR